MNDSLIQSTAVSGCCVDDPPDVSHLDKPIHGKPESSVSSAGEGSGHSQLGNIEDHRVLFASSVDFPSQTRAPADEHITDQQLASQSKDPIECDLDLPSDSISVLAVAGYVAWRVYVDTDEQRRSAEHEVTDLLGIFWVTNRLGINAKLEMASPIKLSHGDDVKEMSSNCGNPTSSDQSGVLTTSGAIHSKWKYADIDEGSKRGSSLFSFFNRNYRGGRW